MTEEEKKAIEYLRKWVHWETAGERNLEGDIETALNLIEKQQKEIEALKEHNEELAKFILNSGLKIIKFDKKDMIIDRDKFAKFKIE